MSENNLNVQTKGRLVYIEPNDMVKYSGIVTGKSGECDNVYWNPEDLNISVDLQVVIPSRDYKESKIKDDSQLFDVNFNINTNDFVSNYISFMSGTEINKLDKNGNVFKGSNELTTEYTDISYQQYDQNGLGRKECLGINSIDINFDAHFYPIVTMKFTDVRAAALFAPEELDYRNELKKNSGKDETSKSYTNFFKSLFHFPYPRFLLSVKGFYGDRVTFILAVNDFKSSFNANTGDFDVTVSFIGYMYGLYTEIPMSYLIVAPYIDSEDDMDGKLLNVGKYWKKRVEEGVFKYIEDGGQTGSDIMTYVEYVKKFTEMADNIQFNGENIDAIGELKNINKNNDSIIEIKNLYDNFIREIRNRNESCEMKNDVEVGYYFYIFNSTIENLKIPSTTYNKLKNKVETYKKYNNSIENSFNEIKNFIEGEGDNRIGTFKNVCNVINKNNIENLEVPDSIKKYVLENVNDKQNVIWFNYGLFYNFINLEIERFEKSKKEIEEYANEEAIKIISNNLGFVPNIENIFRMAFAHLECFIGQFYEVLNKISQQDRRLGEYPFLDIKNNTDLPTLRDSEDKLYPWTGIFKKINGHKEIIYPSDLNIALESMEEVQFVEKIINAINRCKKNAEEIRKEIEVQESNKSNNDKIDAEGYNNYFSDFKPSCILDIFYNGENPYKQLKLKSCDETDYTDICELLWFIGYRVALIKISNNGKELKTNFENNEKNLISSSLIITEELKKKINNIKTGNSIIINNEIEKFIENNKTLLAKYSSKTEDKNVNIITYNNQGNNSIYYGITNIYDISGKPNWNNEKNKHIQIFELNDTIKNCYHNLNDVLNVDQTETIIYYNNNNSLSRLYEIKQKTDSNQTDSDWLTNTLDFGYSANIEDYNGKIVTRAREKKGEGYYFPCVNIGYKNKNENESSINLFSTLDEKGKPSNKMVIDYQDTNEAKALLFLSSLVTEKNGLRFPSINYQYFYDIKQAINGNGSIIMPYYLLLYYGGLCYRYKEIKNGKKFHKGFGDYIPQSNIDEYKASDTIISHEPVIHKSTDLNLMYERNIVYGSYKEGCFYGNDYYGLEDAVVSNLLWGCDKELIKLFEDWCSSYDDIGWKNIYSTLSEGELFKVKTGEGNCEIECWKYQSEQDEILKKFYLKQKMVIITNGVGEFNSYKYEIKWSKSDNNSFWNEKIDDLYITFCTGMTKEVVENNSSLEKANALKELKLSMYCTLKSLNDKWISTYKVNKFLLQEPNIDYLKRKERFETLVDIDKQTETTEYNSFLYVDSYYNDISQKYMINPESIRNLALDCMEGILGKESFYEILARIAQENNLLFMALPVFNNLYSSKSIKNIFTPQNLYSGGVNSRGIGNTYVLMYTHKLSEHLDIDSQNEYYINDGFDLADTLGNYRSLNLDSEGLFSRDTNGNNYTVSAFGVTFAKQNQSYFKNININMDDPAMTDYGIANTLKIAEGGAHGSNDYPVGVGQNIYSIYANRTYSCSVDMMGCANIMPLMYFQLNNIPMFKGAYMITNVQHHITPGNMTTTFKGVRISKNLIPFTTMAFSCIGLLDKVTSKYEYGLIKNNEDITSNFVTEYENGNPKTFNYNGFKPGKNFDDINLMYLDKKPNDFLKDANYSLCNKNSRYVNIEFDVEKAFNAMKTIVNRDGKHPYDTHYYTHYCAAAVRRFVEEGYDIKENSAWSEINGFFCFQPLMKIFGWKIIQAFNISDIEGEQSDKVNAINQRIDKEKLQSGDIILIQYREYGHIEMVMKTKENDLKYISDCNQYFITPCGKRTFNVLVLRAPKIKDKNFTIDE